MPGYRSHLYYEGYERETKLKHFLLPHLYIDAIFKHPHRALKRISIPVLFSQPFATYIGHLCQGLCDISIIIVVDAFIGDPYK